MSHSLAVKIFAQAFSKALSKDLPDLELRPDKRNWKKKTNQFTADDDEPRRQFPSSVGTRASVQRRGRVGTMEVEVMWLGKTANGMRAKVRERLGTKPFWVDRDDLELYATLWPVAKGSV